MQKIIRTFPNGYTLAITRLEQALEEGFKVILCNSITSKDGTVCNDYIVEKEDALVNSKIGTNVH